MGDRGSWLALAPLITSIYVTTTVGESEGGGHGMGKSHSQETKMPGLEDKRVLQNS